MSTQTAENVVGFPTQGKLTPDRSLTARWQFEDLFDDGFVAVPTRFLQLYAHLKPHPLTPGEVIFALQLMTFKWSAASPYPSYKRIAQRMGLTDKMVRRYAQSLEAKGYIKRQKRVSQTNRFDLSGLFEALREAARLARIAELTEAQARAEGFIAEMQFKMGKDYSDA